jgi:hypothetical protein
MSKLLIKAIGNKISFQNEKPRQLARFSIYIQSIIVVNF